MLIALCHYLCVMKVQTNLLTDIKTYYLQELELLYGRHEAESLLNILIKHFLGLSRSDQAINKNFRLNETELLKIYFAVKELKKEKPVQYILGETEFLGLTLKVNQSVLIPRPETEELVSRIIQENTHELSTVLDIGTGSGCIALALKKAFPKSKVIATDVSRKVLAVAKENAKNLNLEIELQEFDVLDELQWVSFPSVDMIVSNPPYVTEKEKVYMKNNVLLYEPAKALFIKDNDPLIFYRKIGVLAKNILKPQGQLWFEINENFGRQIIELLKYQGFATVELIKDFNGKERMIKALL